MRQLARCLDACRVSMHMDKGLITDEGYCCRKRLLAFDDSVFMRVNETELFGVTSRTVSFFCKQMPDGDGRRAFGLQMP